MKIFLFWFLFGTLSALDVGLDFGVREDSLRWSIGLVDEAPNILSELTWKHVRSVNAALSAHTLFYRNIGIGAYVNGGKIFSGDVWDRDWYGNNKTRKFSESNSQANEGYVLDADAALTTVIPVGSGCLTEKLGYAYHRLKLTMIGGWQNDIDNERFHIPMAGLDSSYFAEFYGPYIGFNYTFPICGLLAKFGYDYTFVNYQGNGYWNLRTDFNGHFLHKSKKGSGQTYMAELQYGMGDNLSLGILLFGRYFKAYNGDDYTFFDDDEKIYSWLKLNNVRWTNVSLYIYCIYQFCFAEKRATTRERLRRTFGN